MEFDESGYPKLVKRLGNKMIAKLHSVQLEDLLQAGAVAFIQAKEAYDESRGATFDTYATIRVHGAMIDELRKGDWVPRSVRRNYRRIEKATNSVEMKQIRPAKCSEVAQELDVDINSYNHMREDSYASKLFSLDDTAHKAAKEHGEEMSLMSVVDQVPSSALSPAEIHEIETLKNRLAKGILKLPERDRIVLSLYYKEDIKLVEIGKLMNVSESRASQIKARAVERLKANINPGT